MSKTYRYTTNDYRDPRTKAFYNILDRALQLGIEVPLENTERRSTRSLRREIRRTERRTA